MNWWGGTKKMFSCKHFMLRGLAITLSASLLIGGNTVVYAATTNDLRSSLGLSEIHYGSSGNSSSGQDILDSTENSSVESSTSPNKTTNSDSEYSSIIDRATIEDKIDQCNSEIRKLKSTLSTRLSSGSTAYIIKKNIEDILAKQSELRTLEKSTNDLAIDNVYESHETSTTNTNSAEQFEYDSVIASSMTAAEAAAIDSEDYNIGYIGEMAHSVVENYFQLVTPWGFNKHASEEKYGSKLLGMELYARPGDYIVSQWNGVVVDTGYDDSNIFQYIKIYHGNSTYTTYSHVYAIEGIKIGAKIKQGQRIAVAADTSAYEDKENHILYQVEIDGSYINPLLIYGSSGKKIYEAWYTSHAYDNVVEAGEKYFNDIEKEEVVESNKNDPPEVLYPDFNIDK